MPYKVAKRKAKWCVLVRRASGWRIKKCYSGRGARTRARKYRVALKINTGH